MSQPMVSVAELDLLLPAGHRARLVRDYVARFKLEPQVAQTFGLWLYATLKGVGSAQHLADLCQHSLPFQWLAEGSRPDATRLADFRRKNVDRLDALLADALTGLRLAGVLGRPPTPTSGQAREGFLLSVHAEALAQVIRLREALDLPGADEQKRRAVRQQKCQARQQERLGAAVAELQAVTQARQAKAKRDEEEKQKQLAVQQSAAAPVRDAVPAKVASPRPRSVFMPRRADGFDPALPWAIGREEDGRFKKFVVVSSVFFVVMGSILAIYQPPAVDRAEAEKISPHLAKLVMERKEQIKPEPVKVEEKAKEKKPEEVKQEEAKPAEQKQEVKRELAPIAKSKSTDQQVVEARERASKTGLVAMRDQLAALRELSSTDSLKTEQTRVGAEGAQRAVERDLIGKTATSGSGGVATNTIAHTGGGRLEGRSTSKVAGPTGAPTIAEAEREAKGGKRTAEEIKLAFDANKSAIYGIYRRALRDNPLLEGRVVLKLTVDPAGTVTACNIVSSGLKDPDLEAKLVARIMLINFGTRAKLETWTGSYQIDFVPAS